MAKSTVAVKFRREAIRRNGRVEWAKAVACAFAIACLMAGGLASHAWRTSAKQTDANHNRPRSPSIPEEQQELLRKARLGKVLSADGRNCRAMIFNNISGQSHDGGLTSCSEQIGANGKYEYPGNRLKSIRDGFSKE
jgi:hypothetical protein